MWTKKEIKKDLLAKSKSEKKHHTIKQLKELIKVIVVLILTALSLGFLLIALIKWTSDAFIKGISALWILIILIFPLWFKI